MATLDKSQQQGKQGGGPQAVPQGTIGPCEADAAGSGQQPGGGHKPQQFSQQVAQKIPADPDPDDPVSP